MKKFFSIIAVILITITSVHAQLLSRNTLRISVGVEPALPVGNFNDIGYNFGIGGSLQGEVKIVTDLGVTLNAGYMNYSAKDITIGGTTIKGSNFGVVPVLAGLKYYPSSKVYVHGQLGAGFGTESGTSTFFAYSPGVGIMLSKNFDVLLKYVGYSANSNTLGSVAARVAYTF